MTDALAAQAAREAWLALGRRLFTIPTIGLVAASAVIFRLALRGVPPWWWLLLTGAAPALFALLVVGWTLGLWWAPRVMRRKLNHLPHRRVLIELTAPELTVQTATEQLRLRRTEVRSTRFLPSFYVLRVRAGFEIPVPPAALSGEALAMIQRMNWSPTES